ncbi:Protease synthase and sporulation protein PAI 2 [compost metagenome]
MVQARGIPRVIEDPAWLRAHVEALTDAQESVRTEPWRVSDAPEAFVSSLLKGIVGIEIPIAHLEGKWKVSQNRSEADRHGVQEGLRHEQVSDAMAALVAERGS